MGGWVKSDVTRRTVLSERMARRRLHAAALLGLFALEIVIGQKEDGVYELLPKF